MSSGTFAIRLALRKRVHATALTPTAELGHRHRLLGPRAVGAVFWSEVLGYNRRPGPATGPYRSLQPAQRRRDRRAAAGGVGGIVKRQKRTGCNLDLRTPDLEARGQAASLTSGATLLTRQPRRGKDGWYWHILGRSRRQTKFCVLRPPGLPPAP